MLKSSILLKLFLGFYMAVGSNKIKIGNIFSGIMAACVFGLFWVYRNDIADTFREIDVWWVGLGVVFFLLNYLFRATRIWVLTKEKIAVFPDAVYCSSAHGFATYMLPIRSGELSLPFILKSLGGLDLVDGLKILYKARLLDVLVLGLWLILASILPNSKLPPVYQLGMLIFGILMISLPALLVKISGPLARLKKMRGLATAIADYSVFNITEIFLTLGIWFFSAVTLWCVTAALNIGMSADQLLFLVAIQLIVQISPIQGVANSGNHESGWVAAMVLLGYPANTGLTFALASHCIIIVYVFLLGIIALILRLTLLRTTRISRHNSVETGDLTG